MGLHGSSIHRKAVYGAPSRACAARAGRTRLFILPGLGLLNVISCEKKQKKGRKRNKMRPPSPLSGWEVAVRPEDLALARSHPSYGLRLTDDTFAQLAERGFAIVENYLPEKQRAEMGAALRKILPPLDEQLQRAQPGESTPAQSNTMFPYSEHSLNHAISNDHSRHAG